MSKQEEKEKSLLGGLVSFVVVFLMLYVIYDTLKWLFTSPFKKVLEGILGLIFLIILAVLFYSVVCLITGMPIELGKLFGLV